jgi:regulatory protein
VAAELVATTLDTAYAQVSEEELIRRYVARKRIKKPQDEKETARLVRRLVGAGFSFAIISTLLKSWDLDLLLPEDGGAED